jgi:hypothetical protein
MRTMLSVLSLAAGLGLIAYQPAAALPAAREAIQQAAPASSSIQQAQYAERRGRGGITKCYREFAVGNYVCHTYRSW